MPFGHGGAIHLVRSVAPDFCVLRLEPPEPGARQWRGHRRDDLPVLTCQVVWRASVAGLGELRGNAAPLRLGGMPAGVDASALLGAPAGSTDLLMLVHTRHARDLYSHRFALLRTAPGGRFALAVGPPFSFGARLEFVLGLPPGGCARDTASGTAGDQLVVGFSVYDRETWRAGVRLADALRGLAFYDREGLGTFYSADNNV